MHTNDDAPSGAAQWMLALLALGVLAGTLLLEWARIVGH